MDLVMHALLYKCKKNIFQVSRFPIRAPTVQLFSKIGPVTSPGFLFNIARIFLQHHQDFSLTSPGFLSNITGISLQHRHCQPDRSSFQHDQNFSSTLPGFLFSIRRIFLQKHQYFSSMSIEFLFDTFPE